MKFDIKARYPAPTAVVLKAFSDKAFHEKKLAALGLPKYKVLEEARAGDEYRIRIERKVPLAAPGMIKKFVPAEATVTSEERWNVGSQTGRVKIEPSGVPVEIACTAKFADDAQGCVITYTFDVNARVPLVGGALEKFIASDMQEKFAAEGRAAAPLVAAYR